MNPKPTSRSGRMRVVAVAVTAAVVLISACSSSGDSSTSSDDAAAVTTVAVAESTPAGDGASTAAATIGAEQVELTQALRLLWAQHMEWTYEAVTAYIADAESDLTAATIDRLLQNQQDLGDAIGVYFGSEAGEQSAELLTEHIEGAIPVLDAALAGDEAALDTAIQDWYANSAEIGETIASLNPEHWDDDVFVEMLHAHIEQTVAYAADQVGGDYAQSIVDYDEAKHHMLELADVMAEGIVAEFPDQFSDTDAITPSQLELSNTLRELWHEHMEWTYAAVTAYIADAESDLTAATLERLLQNQQDLGDAVGSFFGDEAGQTTADLLTEHIEGAIPVLDAALAGDAAALETAVEDWYANSAEIGQAIAALNPDNWPVETVEAMMHDHIEQTVAYASAQIEGDYAQSIIDYETAQHHMLGLADVLADGIVAAFPDQFTD